MNHQEYLKLPHFDYEGKNNLYLEAWVNNTLVNLIWMAIGHIIWRWFWCPIQWIFLFPWSSDIHCYLPQKTTSRCIVPSGCASAFLSSGCASAFLKSSLSHKHQRAAFDKDSKSSKSSRSHLPERSIGLGFFFCFSLVPLMFSSQEMPSSVDFCYPWALLPPRHSELAEVHRGIVLSIPSPSF